MNSATVTYRHISCNEMTETDIEATSKLFSENYGVWSNEFPIESKRGRNIQYPPSKIRKEFVSKPDRFVIMAYVGDELAGQIFYLKRKGSKTYPIIIVLQLVVAKKHRNQKIATRMLNSIWQQSLCYAWGLFTSNPKTVKVLEQATMRQVNVKLIDKHIDKIREVVKDVFDSTEWIDSYANGIVSTNFYVSHESLANRIRDVYKDDEFALPEDLPEGKEWLAVTFRSQNPSFASEEEWMTYLDYSQADIVSAYSNMKMTKQSWAKHTVSEVDYLTQNYIKPGDSILDFGCGFGRHSAELGKRGYHTTGIDFSAKKIAEARKLYEGVDFVCEDIRSYRSNQLADIVLCLYDVVGSFPNQSDNLKILRSANKSLKTGGRIIMSVMNMDLTRDKCKYVVDDIRESLDVLLDLPSSNTMQETGDIFDGTKMIIEESTGIVYRKEQFSPEDSLPCELIVRDRRYTAYEISQLLNQSGFDVERFSYFQAGKMEKPLKNVDRNAKEILVVARKPSALHRVSLVIKASVMMLCDRVLSR